MNNLLRVVGKCPYYGILSVQFISENIVSRIVPLYAVIENGVAYKCTPDHVGAELHNLEIYTHDGKVFRCWKQEDLEYLLSREWLAELGKKIQPDKFGFHSLSEKGE
jgi:hypothetical protein